MSTTYNISRAYKFPRNKRAAKAVKILQRKIKKSEDDVEFSNELNNLIWKKGMQKPPKKVTVDFISQDDKTVVIPVEQDKKTSTTSESKDTEEVEESVLDGTVSDAKDAISEMEDPDYEELLEQEKSGKDRKTLVEWLEGKV